MKLLAIYQKYYPRGMNYLKGPKNDALKFKILSEIAQKNNIDLQVDIGHDQSYIKSDYDVVYFSGHGTVASGKTQLCAPRKRNTRFRHYLTEDDFIDSTEVSKDALLLLDCCFAEGFKSTVNMRKSIIGYRIAQAKVKSYEYGITESELKGFAHDGIFASRHNEASYDINVSNGYGGAFTWAFLNAMALAPYVDYDKANLEEVMVSLCYGLGAHQHPVVKVSDDKWGIFVDLMNILKDVISLLRRI